MIASSLWLLVTTGIAASAPVPSQAPAVPPPAPVVNEEPPSAETEPPTLENKVPPVSGQTFSKAGRLEITPGIGLSFNDAFYEKFIPELSVGYHFNDPFYLGLRGGYAFDAAAGRVNACQTTATGLSCGAPTQDQLKQLPGNFKGTASLEGAWTPVYGKVNLIAEKVLHFDLSVLLGGGVVFLGQQVGTNNPTVAPALSPGLGERFFLGSAVALSFEVRDCLYAAGGVQNQLLFEAGLTFLL